MSPASALYRGEVVHQRLRPRRHRLRYRAFWLWLDLAEIDALASRLRLFSRNRFNLLSFHDGDHGDGSPRPLAEQIEAHLRRAGIDLGAGKAIRILTMPRVVGYVFNPISVYYCYGSGGRLAAMVYEVTSTFKVRHCYVIAVLDGLPAASVFHQTCSKALHVSPFMGMDMAYDFRGTAPGDKLALAIDALDGDGVLLIASMSGRRHALGDGALLRAAAAVPLLTLKVVAAIHWEALKLWLKGVPLRPGPADPASPSSIGRAQARATARCTTSVLPVRKPTSQ